MASAAVEQELVAAAQEVAALFRDHPFVPRTWVEVQRFVAAVAHRAGVGALEEDSAAPAATTRPPTTDRPMPRAVPAEQQP